MNRFDHQWQKLTALARQTPADAGAPAPYGFVIRMAAQAAALPAATPWHSLERFALRGLLAAAACSVAAAVFNYATFQPDSADDEVAGDTVSEVLDLT